jgi:ABC-2 type transport system ATP-binding protein
MSGEVELRELTVRYGATVAVDGLSLRLQGPAIHGLLGRNGSGKTSLLSAVAAFRPPSGGEVLIDGEPVFENPTATRKVCFIRGVGDTVEHDWPGDRVRDALGLAARLRPAWDSEYADKLVDRFGLSPRKRLGELSRGQRSSLGVVLGLASRAPVTIFDESYLGMDAPSRYAFYDELLNDYLAHPRTIVVSTHLIEEVAPLFEHVAIIDQGRLLLHEPADELRARGATVIGPAEQADRFTAGMTTLAMRELGPTRSVTVDGVLDEADRRRAAELGLELGPVALQDLFVHLTEPGGRP